MLDMRTELEEGEIPSEGEEDGEIQSSNENDHEEASIDKIINEVTINEIDNEAELLREKLLAETRARRAMNDVTKSVKSTLKKQKSQSTNSSSSTQKSRKTVYISSKRSKRSRSSTKEERQKRKRDRSKSGKDSPERSHTNSSRSSAKRPAPLHDTKYLEPPPAAPIIFPAMIEQSDASTSYLFNSATMLLPPPPPPPLPHTLNVPVSYSTEVDNCEPVDMDIEDEENPADEQREPPKKRASRDLSDDGALDRLRQELIARNLAVKARKKQEEEKDELIAKIAELVHQYKCLNFSMKNAEADRLRILREWKESGKVLKQFKTEMIEVLEKKKDLESILHDKTMKLLKEPESVPESLNFVYDEINSFVPIRENVEDTVDDPSCPNSSNTSSDNPVEEEVVEIEPVVRTSNELSETELRQKLLQTRAIRSRSRSASEPRVQTADQRVPFKPDNFNRLKAGRDLLLNMCKFDMNGICERGATCKFYHLEKGEFNERLMLESIFRNIYEYSEEDIGLAISQMLAVRQGYASFSIFVKSFLSHTMDEDESIRNRFYDFYSQGLNPVI